MASCGVCSAEAKSDPLVLSYAVTPRGLQLYLAAKEAAKNNAAAENKESDASKEAAKKMQRQKTKSLTHDLMSEDSRDIFGALPRQDQDRLSWHFPYFVPL